MVRYRTICHAEGTAELARVNLSAQRNMRSTMPRRNNANMGGDDFMIQYVCRERYSVAIATEQRFRACIHACARNRAVIRRRHRSPCLAIHTCL